MRRKTFTCVLYSAQRLVSFYSSEVNLRFFYDAIVTDPTDFDVPQTPPRRFPRQPVDEATVKKNNNVLYCTEVNSVQDIYSN